MRLDILEQAQAVRNAMNGAGSMLTDEQAIEVIELYMPWRIGEDVFVGDMCRDEGKLYRCLQAHTTQADWRPASVPALWVEIAPAGQYREIKGDMLPTEAFALNEIGWYQTKDNLWRSLIDANTYTPDTYPAGWEAYSE